VDAIIAGGREKFVELLKKFAEQTIVRRAGGAPDGQPVRGRPTFTKQEQMQRQAESDATKMVGAAAKAKKTTLETQQLIKAGQAGNRWFPCMNLDDTNSCYCERVFRRPGGLAAHTSSATATTLLVRRRVRPTWRSSCSIS
jgi:hypothetical protein